jgi:hypothetical protein
VTLEDPCTEAVIVGPRAPSAAERLEQMLDRAVCAELCGELVHIEQNVIVPHLEAGQ